MLVIAAPGQGAQAPGFLTPWLDLPGLPATTGRSGVTLWVAIILGRLVHKRP